VSSKTARLRRRQAARARAYNRLRKVGRLPVHTRTERLREAAQRRADRERQAGTLTWMKRGTLVMVAAGGAAAVVALVPVQQDHSAHYTGYPFATTQDQMSLPLPRPDPFHGAEPDGTYFTPYVGPGTTAVSTWHGTVPSGGHFPGQGGPGVVRYGYP
jgi:hypothetical protein